MKVRRALCCGALVWAIEVALADDVPIPMSADQIGIRTQVLRAVFRQAKVNCAEGGRVPFVTRVTADGWPEFACVPSDDLRYQGQQTMTDMDTRLRPLVGQYIQHVEDLLGAPQSQSLVNGDAVYAWGHMTQYLLRLPAPVGDVLEQDGMLPLCKIKLTVDRNTQVIKNYEYAEQRGGCWPYGQKLDGHSSP